MKEGIISSPHAHEVGLRSFDIGSYRGKANNLLFVNYFTNNDDVSVSKSQKLSGCWDLFLKLEKARNKRGMASNRISQ